RIGNHTARPFLEGKQLAHHLLQMLGLLALDQSVGVSVLGVGVAAEVDAATKLPRASHDWKQLIEVVALDHSIEPDPGDADLSHARNGEHDRSEEHTSELQSL